MKIFTYEIFFLLYLVTLSHGLFIFNIISPRIITTSQGEIRGLRTTYPFMNIQYDSYQGIPYARPPFGNLTFEPPVPSENWEGVLNATNESPMCPQRVDNNGKCYQGQLDCLYLNIYVPLLNTSRNLPVMVWIHGGGFIFGSNNKNLYGPEYLLKKKVIIVSVNYRLGAYGFMSLGTRRFPGNVGLKDQRLALEWIYTNIRYFKGDPNDITIFGESSGAASVHYHVLSPTSNRFTRAIAQSGTALDPDKNIRNRTLILARELGCIRNSRTTDQQIVDCLEDTPVNDLLSATDRISDQEESENNTSSVVPELGIFSPTSEPDGTPNAFFTGDPEAQIRSGNFSKVPFITGVNSAEAVNIFTVIWPKIDSINENFTRIFPLRVQDGIRNLNLSMENISRNTKEFYFNNYSISVLNVNNFIECLSDILFLQSAWRSIYLMSLADSHNDQYFYEFSFYGALSYPKIRFLSGAGHADELPYLFFQSRPVSFLLPRFSYDEQMIDIMTSLWTGFAINGTPTSDWTPVNPGSIDYYNIDRGILIRPQMENASNSLGRRIDFWRRQYQLQ